MLVSVLVKRARPGPERRGLVRADGVDCYHMRAARLSANGNRKSYWYDFTVRGRRHRVSTHETKSVKALKIASLKLAGVPAAKREPSAGLVGVHQPTPSPWYEFTPFTHRYRRCARRNRSSDPHQPGPAGQLWQSTLRERFRFDPPGGQSSIATTPTTPPSLSSDGVKQTGEDLIV